MSKLNLQECATTVEIITIDNEGMRFTLKEFGTADGTNRTHFLT